MSKDISGEFNKTLGEQSGSAKTHLDSVVVRIHKHRSSMVKQTNFTMFLQKTWQI